MKLPVVYVWTHDSVGLGEDGPTHQPVETYAALRAIPGLWFMRPADANETAAAWKVALERTDGPVALSLSRQKVPTLDRSDLAPASARRARRVHALGVELVAGPDPDRRPARRSGSTLAAGRKLAEDGTAVRVVSMPCWELFEDQPTDYRDEVLPPEVRARLSIEPGVALGWEQVGRRPRRLDLARALRRLGARATVRAVRLQLDNVVARSWSVSRKEAEAVKTFLSIVGVLHRQGAAVVSSKGSRCGRRSRGRDRPPCASGSSSTREIARVDSMSGASQRRHRERARSSSGTGGRLGTDAVRSASTTRTRRARSARRSSAARPSAASSSAARASARRSPPASSPASARRSATTSTARTRASSTTT